MGCCKNCGCSTEPEQLQLAIDGPIVALARFPSLAECGFFADELSAATNVTTETRTQDEFDPLTNNWSASYVLCVHEKDAESAMGFLSQRKVTGEDAGDEFEEDFSTQPTSRETHQAKLQDADIAAFTQPSLFGWLIPMLMTAAVAAGGTWLYLEKAKGPNPSGSVVTELERYGRQWIQKNSTGRIVRQMTFDQKSRVMEISEDAEGDGEFERSREFQF